MGPSSDWSRAWTPRILWHSFDAAKNDVLRLHLDSIPIYLKLETNMISNALFLRLEAKPGKEKEVEQFLQAGLGIAKQEGTTPVWMALKLGPSTFGVFEAFEDEAGRQAHINGPVGQALKAKASTLLAQAPSVEPIDVFGTKLPG